MRQEVLDTRVHCCLYFISPNGHGSVVQGGGVKIGVQGLGLGRDEVELFWRFSGLVFFVSLCCLLVNRIFSGCQNVLPTKKTIPHHTTLQKPHYATPHHTTPRHTTPHHTTETTPRHTTPHHTTETTPHHTTQTTPHHTSLHRLRQLDVECMKQLHEKVNIIPLIAKADSMTLEECRDFKKTVSHFYSFTFKRPLLNVHF